MARPAAITTEAPRRAPLTRQRVLGIALGLVDAEGLEALSMRRLGAELGVEAMSVYKHVANKNALLDGVVEQLWTEVQDATAQTTDWAEVLRSFAHAVRAMMQRHPRAAPLLFGRAVLPPPALETWAILLDVLREAGFEDDAAAETVRSTCAYSMGFGMSELYCFGAWRATPGQQAADTAQSDATSVLLWLGRNLPGTTPPRLVNAARSMLECNPDRDFQASLEMVIQGLRQLHKN